MRFEQSYRERRDAAEAPGRSREADWLCPKTKQNQCPSVRCSILLLRERPGSQPSAIALWSVSLPVMCHCHTFPSSGKTKQIVRFFVKRLYLDITSFKCGNWNGFLGKETPLWVNDLTGGRERRLKYLPSGRLGDAATQRDKVWMENLSFYFFNYCFPNINDICFLGSIAS